MIRKNTAEAGAIDYGVLWGFVFLILVFEVVPGSSIGRLASRTVTDEMQGFDPGELYEIPPEMPEEDQIDVQNIIDNEIPDVVEPILIISTTEDTEGLGSAFTVSTNNLAPDDNPDNIIPDPGTFVPHSVHPVCTFRPVPEYPDMARQAGVEGRVILQVFISPQGIPVEAIIAESSGLGSMDSAAMASVMESSWSPARRDDGVPVGVWTSVVYNFVLN
ncbi:MAG: energy transducer TonB [Candidatus Aegiribacteria sp.]|nr:energy transducer TonB [Candidatus Aegiribacteria sp.]